MATTRYRSADAELDLLYDDLAAGDVQPLWEMHGLLTAVPAPRAVPWVWRGPRLRELAERAADVVPPALAGDRRVLACANPGLGGSPYALPTLWVAVQSLGPGDSAPSHRHTPAALRFVLEGDGVRTTVEGDALRMSAGDLVLTPSWTYHSHDNPGGDGMVWLDVLDLPVVEMLGAVFFQRGDATDAPHAPGPPTLPLLAHRWADTDRALRAILAVGDREHAWMRYADPRSGRDVMPTLRCEMLRVRPGASTPRRRETGSRACCVLHGTGLVRIGDREHALAPGDVVALPSWSEWSFEAADQLDVFTCSDSPVIEALELHRRDRPGGRA